MKGKRSLLVGLVLGGVIGWALGFLRFPYVEGGGSFWVGFVACLAFASLLLALMALWRRDRLLLGLVGRRPRGSSSRLARIWAMAALLIVLGSVGGILLLAQENMALRSEVKALGRDLDGAVANIAELRSGSLGALMAGVLEEVEGELKENPDSGLSSGLIGRVVALSRSLEPYRLSPGDSLPGVELSPERGALLAALAFMDIDSVSFALIKAEAVFAQADLKGQVLRGVDLSGVDLRGARLRDADLSGSDLNGADLRRADLNGAVLDSASLLRADLKRADLAWAELNGADLRMADLNGAQLGNAKLRGAALEGVLLQWAAGESVLFNGADLSGADLLGSLFHKANMAGAVLRGTYLERTDLTEANLEGADLEGALLRWEDWFDQLEMWRVKGAQALRKSYSVVEHGEKTFSNSNFRLEKKAP